ncbi:MAG: hypothetical protein KO206_04795 [Methanomicrobiaceae archaeon]|uniref:Uncharacterized protein n=1 Tax=hydrocarbon metagenome TaxID=938273 RepID=A0A0W8FHE9_9ZZZZ|nr:hypothetical protein [Methanomicrobiaceae archaeon]
MVTLRLLAVDDVSFQLWTYNNPTNDIWVVFQDKYLFPEFLKHFYQTWGRDQTEMPYSESFF